MAITAKAAAAVQAGGYSYNNENVDSNAAASGGDYAHYNISGSDPWIRGYDDQVFIHSFIIQST